MMRSFSAPGAAWTRCRLQNPSVPSTDISGPVTSHALYSTLILTIAPSRALTDPCRVRAASQMFSFGKTPSAVGTDGANDVEKMTVVRTCTMRHS